MKLVRIMCARRERFACRFPSDTLAGHERPAFSSATRHLLWTPSHQRLVIACCGNSLSCFYNPLVGFNPTRVSQQGLTADRKKKGRSGSSAARVDKDRVMFITLELERSWLSLTTHTIDSGADGGDPGTLSHIRWLRPQRKKRALIDNDFIRRSPQQFPSDSTLLVGSRNRHHHHHHHC